ncbi:AraC family transcriptional regulator [Paenibacillus lautus]|uniref:AraC family transcriptional regulator n=1 Tax=Paenibacillus lautus TaxID=1401 RepID=UPI000FDB6826|nr:AraC family transcriptional regulator [Paenibacillus lautus]
MDIKKPVPDFVTFEDMYTEICLYGAHISVVEHPGMVCQRHLHHMMYELNYVLEGSQTCIINDQSFTQQTGDLVIIPPMMLHQYRVESGARTKYFVAHIKIIEPTFLQKMMKAAPMMIHPDTQLSRNLNVPVQDLMMSLENKESFISILHRIFDISFQIEQFCEHESVLLQSDQDLSYQIAREIEKLLVPSEKLGEESFSNWLEQISNRLGFSRRHCSRIFREVYQMSPRDYLSILRQQEAMQFLLNGNDSIEQIAYRIGYENVQSFIRQFTKWTGMTPGKFRKKQDGAAMYLTPLEERI